MGNVYVLLEDYGDGSSLMVTVYGILDDGMSAWKDVVDADSLDIDPTYINTWNGHEASYIDAGMELRLERRDIL